MFRCLYLVSYPNNADRKLKKTLQKLYSVTNVRYCFGIWTIRFGCIIRIYNESWKPITGWSEQGEKRRHSPSLNVQHSFELQFIKAIWQLQYESFYLKLLHASQIQLNSPSLPSTEMKEHPFAGWDQYRKRAFITVS